jgi:hypothetical protein
MEQKYYARVEVLVMLTLYANTFVGFITLKLIRLHMDHICIVVQRLVVLGFRQKNTTSMGQPTMDTKTIWPKSQHMMLIDAH